MPVYRNPNTRPLSGYCLPWVAELASGEKIFCDTRDGAREILREDARTIKRKQRERDLSEPTPAQSYRNNW